MFSIMTIASSTTKPAEIVSDMSERLLRLKPSRYITPKVPTRERGTERLGIRVAGTFLRKAKMTKTTRMTASVSSTSTSSTEARIVLVRSVRTATSTDGGSEAWRAGRSFLMLSTTLITLAPGWRWMFRMRAGVLLYQAPNLVFSGALSIVATSERRTAAPFR